MFKNKKYSLPVDKWKEKGPGKKLRYQWAGDKDLGEILLRVSSRVLAVKKIRRWI